MPALPLPLPRGLDTTRESLRALACFVIAPSRKAVDGHIGLQATEGGFGTPVVGEPGRQVAVRGATLVARVGAEERSAPITTLADAAELVGIGLVPDPGVGADIPPFHPDANLPVEPAAAAVIAGWYELGSEVLRSIALRWRAGAQTEATLWPEHFDLAAVHRAGDDDDLARTTNLGFSPGDATSPEPYLYVGPWQTEALHDPYWNRPFGAVLGYEAVAAAHDPVLAALTFLEAGLTMLAAHP